MKIGFIGLGILGTPMALHPINAGHHLYVKTRSAVPAAVAVTNPVPCRALPCASAEAVAREAEVVFLMLPDTADVHAVLFGEAGVAAGLLADTTRKVVVDMHSISPMATKTVAQPINALGADSIDAPVSGGDVAAIAASLTIMCGGEPAVFERVLPLLQLMGKTSCGWVATVTGKPPKSPTKLSWR